MIEVTADPRYSLHLPCGVAYRIHSDVSLLIRLEGRGLSETPVLGLNDLVEVSSSRLDELTIDPPSTVLDEKAIYHAHVVSAEAL